MRRIPPRAPFRRRASVLLSATLAVACAAHAQSAAPIAYTVRVPAPDSHYVAVEARIPTDGRPSVDLMMPIWSPGFYRVENYAERVRDVVARAPDGSALLVEQPRPNRWRVRTGGAATVTLAYRVAAEQRSVTTDWASADLGVLNGAPTFITLVESGRRPHDVTLIAPASWPRAMTGLPPAPGTDASANHWRTADYDQLVDSPIVAGDLDVHTFTVGGTEFDLVDAGEHPGWDGARAAADLAKVVRANEPVWGDIPFPRYVFLNVFRQGGGGLEHANSTLLTANAARATTPEGYHRWLSFVAHEFIHAWNVKRLRPIELGPFDYEQQPHTTSLWIAEGLTSYYAELALARSGLSTTDQLLADLSAGIAQLQSEPGRLVQTLEQSSSDVWNNSLSGVNPSAATVSYYEKGEVAGLLLDAEIRRLTSGRRSLDDAMRLAYHRYGGARGFTAAEFEATVEEVAGASLGDWFHRTIASAGELDYSGMLDWYGLRFAEPEGSDAARRWALVARDDATDAQRAHLHDLVSSPSR
jgi:predicted metalloprotease with PDZ domain